MFTCIKLFFGLVLFYFLFSVSILFFMSLSARACYLFLYITHLYIPPFEVYREAIYLPTRYTQPPKKTTARTVKKM
nr:MAG TPA: hypothetical protein [Caudoviricetes sp.]